MEIFKKILGFFKGRGEPKGQTESAGQLAQAAYREIECLVKEEALSLIFSKNPFDRYLDIRIPNSMVEVSITNSSLENFYKQDPATGKFSYPPTKRSPKVHKIATTEKAQQELSKEAFETYKQELCNRLARDPFENFRDGQVFNGLRDTNTFFCPHDLGTYFDSDPGSMIFTDF